MARLDALPSVDIIRGFKGVLDFYLWKGLPCVRSWPYTPPSRRTAGTKAAASLFGEILSSYRLVADTVQEYYVELAAGIPRTPRDIYVSGTLGHLHERTLPPVPPTTFTVWSPDAPPLAPSTLDDEFDDASFDLGLWTEFDPGGLLAVSENETGLILDGATHAADAICGIYQTIPLVDFTITAKLALLARRADFAIVGLGLWQDAANPAAGIYAWQLTCRELIQQIELTRWTNYTTWAATAYLEADDIIGTHLYLRIRRVGNTCFWDWSSNGIGWRHCHSGVLAFTPLHFGIMLNNVNVGETIRGVSTFFRYTPYGQFHLLLQGDRISETRQA